MEEVDRLIPWFRLRSVPGVGNLLFRRLLDAFGAPDAVFEADPDALARVRGISPKMARAIVRQEVTGAILRELDQIRSGGYRIVTPDAPAFPPLLREIPDPPPFLYLYGRLDSGQRNIAVVGSRNPTPYGLQTTAEICRELAHLRMVVVSGMARGIDTAAHEGALSAGGCTVAVLGSGFHHVYPPENTGLFHRIAETGAVVTEFPLNTPPDGRNFPIRNRIISGMSLGTVVMEAAHRSGSLITARLAAEQNREVYAVPGNIRSPNSAGTHSLIRQGAKLVESVRDITEELVYRVPFEPEAEKTRGSAAQLPPLTAEEARVLAALGPEPVHIDTLCRSMSLPPGQLSAILLQLELKDLVCQLPGKSFTVAPRLQSERCRRK